MTPVLFVLSFSKFYYCNFYLLIGRWATIVQICWRKCWQFERKIALFCNVWKGLIYWFASHILQLIWTTYVRAKVKKLMKRKNCMAKVFTMIWSLNFLNKQMQKTDVKRHFKGGNILCNQIFTYMNVLVQENEYSFSYHAINCRRNICSS